MSLEEINVLVLDDSRDSRRILSEVALALPRVVMCGSGAPDADGIARIGREDIHVVLLAATAGLQVLDALRRRYPHVGVIMVSDAERRQAELTLAAMDAGALGFVRRPAGNRPGEGHADLVRQIFPLVCAFNARRIAANASSVIRANRHAISPEHDSTRKRRRPTEPLKPNRRIELVAIGISAGGPEALQHMIPFLPADLGVPILLVQHMPPVFTRSLAERLDRVSALTVREAEAGEAPQAGTILIAPGGLHMVLVSGIGIGRTIALHDRAPVHGCRPSVDVLFHSIAECGPLGVLTAIMTGMGSDGCAGVRAIKKRGGYCITQDEASCAVYGMPKAVEDAGLSDEPVPLSRMATRIGAIVAESRKLA